MANVFDYLSWRGDLTFQEREFCEIDNVVLSDLSYTRLSSTQNHQATVYEIANDASLETLNETNLKHLNLVNSMAKTNRFKNLVVHDYLEVFNEDTKTDFSAMTIDLSESLSYVSFRGTTHSILGWQEDISMSYELMSSHPLAERYLRDMLVHYPNRSFYVGGHSKGGNLAVYASMMLESQYGSRILKIYSNDGPGFCKEVFDLSKYRKITYKLTRIVPEFCVVGALFEAENPDYIVRSEETGIAQHSELSWQIEQDHFVTVTDRSPECEYINQIIDEWVESATMEQRKSFSKDFFEALQASGAKSVDDLSGNGTYVVEDILIHMFQADKKTKVVLGKFVSSFINTLTSIQWSNFIKERRTIQGLFALIVGIFFVVQPTFSLQILGTMLGVLGIVYFARKQYHLAFGKDHNIKTAEGRFILNLALMCFITYLTAQESFILQFSNYILGITFLYIAYRLAKVVTNPVNGKWIRFLYGIAMVITFVTGTVPIVTGEIVMEEYMLSAGSVIILLSAIYILIGMYREAKENLNHSDKK